MKNRLFPALAAALSLCVFSVPVPAQDLQPYLSREDVTSSVEILPPPPAEGSIEFLMDKIAFWNYYQLRDTERGLQAVRDADMSDAVLLQFEEAFGMTITKETMPETYELLMRSKECFGTSGCGAAKSFYKRVRPFVYFSMPTLTPGDEGWLRTNWSYPSGHSANFHGLARILSDLRPERREAIQLRAEQGGISRLIVGVHWMSDVNAGKVVAAAVYERLVLNPEFQAQFKKAQAEVRRMLAASGEEKEAA